MLGQLLLLAVLAGTVGLGAAGWVVGIACGVVMNFALARGLSRHGTERIGPAVWVTITRASLAVGVAALTADSFDRSPPVATLVGLTAVALVLDLVDGKVARRTETTSALGARFDGEVDAFLIAVLSVSVAPAAGWWVLGIGAARYLFLAGEWLVAWMRRPLPPAHWRKVVAATQGIVLMVAATGVLPPVLTQVVLAVALAVLVVSFGRDTWWLWRRRPGAIDVASAAGGDAPVDGVLAERVRRGPVRTVLAGLLSVLALAVVWGALVAPNHSDFLEPGVFARVPIEGLVVIALALVLPATGRRLLAWIVGPILGVLLLLKVLDMAFFSGFDRRFNPVDDWSYAGIGIETLRESIGRTQANLVVAVLAVLIVILLVAPTLALRRLSRVAAAHRRRSFWIVAALAAVWVLSFITGAHFVTGAPVASSTAASQALHEGRAVRTGLAGRAAFAREIGKDPYRGTPADRLLTGLRGKDVLLVFVESYGKVASENAEIAPPINTVLANGTRQLQAAGFSAQSAWLTSPTYGGISWLAHSTMQSGVWVDSPRRYDQLVTSGRFTLSKAFEKAGWRTVDDVPAHDRKWPEGVALYGYDQVYDQRNLGYRGPAYQYAPMPDQYVLGALQRLELAKPDRGPLFAEIDLVSSHIPWTKIPRLVDWNQLGDGSIFKSIPVDQVTPAALFQHPDRVREAYGRSIEYSMNAVFSFVQEVADPDLVVVLLGDHQPASIVSGRGASHDVPISVIAHDPKVLDQISGWGWQDGMLPGAAAPVWPMSAFRDRFLGAFSTPPAS